MISDPDSGTLAFDVPKIKAPCAIKEMDGWMDAPKIKGALITKLITYVV